MYLDTRELETKREELEEAIYESFIEEFPDQEDEVYDFADIDLDNEDFASWKEDWADDLEEVEDIRTIEDEVGSEFSYGVTLIPRNSFTEYCKELLDDIGDLPNDLPSYIENNINWDGVADDLEVDYSSLNYQGVEYLYRS